MSSGRFLSILLVIFWSICWEFNGCFKVVIRCGVRSSSKGMVSGLFWCLGVDGMK